MVRKYNEKINFKFLFYNFIHATFGAQKQSFRPFLVSLVGKVPVHCAGNSGSIPGQINTHLGS